MQKPVHIMLCAGEASGDMHAANLVRHLQHHADIRFSALGGKALKDQGVDILLNNETIAVMGLIEVIKQYPTLHRALNTMRQALREQKPDLLILVDYVEFNLKLAETAKKLGIKVLFYISPQVWAWRPKRVKKIGQLVDMMAVIFPFEAEFYQQHAIPVRYVGHPLIGEVVPEKTIEQARTDYQLKAGSPVIGLLPGSRRSEIRYLLPLFLQAAKEVQKQLPEAQFLLPLASSLNLEDIESHCTEPPENFKIIPARKPYDVMQCCDAILTASGTATLETALMKVPMVLAYRTSRLTYALFSRMIQIPDIGLVNVVAGKRIVQEFLQDKATPEALSAELLRILSDEKYRLEMLAEFEQVEEKIGSENGSENVAKLALEMLDIEL